jgi:hypothetical protein
VGGQVQAKKGHRGVSVGGVGAKYKRAIGVGGQVQAKKGHRGGGVGGWGGQSTSGP